MKQKNNKSTLIDCTSQIHGLLERQKRFLAALEKTLKRSRQAPVTGHLRTSNGRYYYITEESDRFGHYLNQSQKVLISKLAQQEYRQKLLKAVQENLKAIERILQLLPPPIHGVYHALSPARQRVINPYVLTDEQFIDQWLAEEFERKALGEDVAEYITERGEHVRSKSEKIIADKLALLGIPYRYEAALFLHHQDPTYSDTCLFPDFTILDMNTRQEIYWEHLGMMDDENYANHALQRLALYAENGIWPGQGLILTFESSTLPFSGRGLEEMLRPYTKP